MTFNFIFIGLLILMGLSSFRAWYLQNAIIDRLQHIYPNDYVKYLYFFNLKLKYAYFIKNIRSGKITDKELLRYYDKSLVPYYSMYVFLSLAIATILFDMFSQFYG